MYKILNHTLFLTLAIGLAQAKNPDAFNRKVDQLGLTLDLGSLEQAPKKKGKKNPYRAPASKQHNAKEKSSEQRIHYASGLNVPLQTLEHDEFLSSIDGVIFDSSMYNEQFILRSFLLEQRDMLGLKRFLETNKLLYFTLKGHEDYKIVLLRTPDSNHLYFFDEYLQDSNYNRFLYSLRSLLMHKLNLKTEIKNFKDFRIDNWYEAQQDYPTTEMTIQNISHKAKESA